MKFVNETEITFDEVMASADYFALAESVGLVELQNIDSRMTQDVMTLLMETVSARCGEEIAVYALEGEEEREKRRFQKAFLGYVLSGCPKWLDRLDAHTAATATGYMTGIKSSTTNRDYFNDAPSIKNPDVEDLSHVATFAKATSETESDPGSVAGRIAEIDSAASAIYSEWADEIIGRFSLGV